MPETRTTWELLEEVEHATFVAYNFVTWSIRRTLKTEHWTLYRVESIWWRQWCQTTKYDNDDNKDDDDDETAASHWSYT